MKDDLREKLIFSARIKGTEPSAVYMERVYTQLVLVEFANGAQEYVLDDFMLCTPDTIGETKEIILVMLVLSLEKIETAGMGIDKPLDAQRDYAGPKWGLNGRVEEIIPDDPQKTERWHDAIVDFGVGKILIDIDKEYFYLQLKTGDYVHVYGRVDLQSIGSVQRIG